MLFHLPYASLADDGRFFRCVLPEVWLVQCCEYEGEGTGYLVYAVYLSLVVCRLCCVVFSLEFDCSRLVHCCFLLVAVVVVY